MSQSATLSDRQRLLKLSQGVVAPDDHGCAPRQRTSRASNQTEEEMLGAFRDQAVKSITKSRRWSLLR